MADDVWEMVADQRRQTLELVESLTEEQLSLPSLCEGWAVRDVAGHVAWVALATPPEVVREVLLAGGKVHRAIDVQAKTYGSLGTDVLVEKLRLAVDSRIVTPTITAESLASDTLVHNQDIRRPLGLAAAIDPALLRLALDHYLGANRFTGGKKRVKGLRLVATDLDWSLGSGPEVRGPGEALLLAAVGRGAALADLDGDGLQVLQQRIA